MSHHLSPRVLGGWETRLQFRSLSENLLAALEEGMQQPFRLPVLAFTLFFNRSISPRALLS